MAAACRAARPRATLRGHLASLLHVGDVLIFEEVVSPTTFVAEDADRTHRWAVRLTEVDAVERPVGAAVRRAAGRRPRSTSPRSPGTPPTRCRSRCAFRSTERPGLEVSVALRQHRARRPWPHRRRRGAGHRAAGHPAARRGGAGRLLRQARADRRCRRASGRRSPSGPLSHGFDLAALLAVPISVDEAWWPASSLLAIDPRAAMPRSAR